MDILAHGLWTAAAAREAQQKSGHRIHAGWAAFWGIFPDLFAFGIPIAIVLAQRLAGSPPPLHAGRHLHLPLVGWLYPTSHSFVICLPILALVWLAARRPLLPMLGWPFHIFIDMWSHSDRFYPTPILFPLSRFHISGIAWSNRWFMLANYVALAIVYFLMWRRAHSSSKGVPLT